MANLFKTWTVLQTLGFMCYGFSDTGAVKVSTGSKLKPVKTNCCQNKGICILGTFCKCKRNYFGRHCEHRVEFKPCGHILHGAWIKADCDLCKCFDGKMSCIPRIYDGCDDDGTLLDIMMPTKNPLKAKKIEVLSNDRDFQDVQQDQYNMEDYYYIDEENTSDNFRFDWPITTIAAITAFVLR